MKKRVVTVFLTGLLAASMLLGGCTSKSEKKALEYKELGIKQLQQEDYDGAVDSFQKALDQSLGRLRQMNWMSAITKLWRSTNQVMQRRHWKVTVH